MFKLLKKDADTSPIFVGGGKVTFTTSFKYLGCMISSNLSDESEVEAKIRSASAAFASLRQQFFGSKMIQPAYKKEAYEGLILSILLHGCETWNLTQELYRRLQCFHNRCVRIMKRINPKLAHENA